MKQVLESSDFTTKATRDTKKLPPNGTLGLMTGKWRVVTLICLCQVLVMALWFSTTAVVPSLQKERALGCCWSLLLMFVAVTIHLLWMLILGTIMAIEKNVAWGNRISAPLGVLLILAAVILKIGA